MIANTPVSDKEKEIFASNIPEEIVTGPRLGFRHIQISLLFVLMVILFSVKSCLPVAIVAMTDSTTTSNPDIPAYDWTNANIILSSFLWGFVVFQAFAGYVGKKYGPKWILFTSVLIAGIGSAFIPLAAENLGSKGVIICRVTQGLALGFVIPSTHAVLGNWSPLPERAVLGTITYLGCNLGSVFGTLVTGYMSASWWGWPSAFYLLTGICFLWCVLWGIFGFDTPEKHPHILYEEKIYIMSSLGQKENTGELITPWKPILVSRHFWALVAGSIGNVWIVTTFVMETPTYLNKVMGLDVEDISLITTLSNGITMAVGLTSAAIADRLVTRNVLSIIATRRFFHVIGNVPPAICLIFFGYLPVSQPIYSVAFITIILAFQSMTCNSFTVNHMDLSPRFSGVTMGVSNMAAQALSICAPILAQFIITGDQADISQWRILFFVSSAIALITATVFVVCASGERQWWDEGDTKKEKNKSKQIEKV